MLFSVKFERTGDHLFEAAYHAQDDALAGISRLFLENTFSFIPGNTCILYTCLVS